MEAAGNGHRDDFVVMWREDGGELADAFSVGARGLSDVERTVDAEDVAAFDGGRRGDVGEFSKRCERLRQRLGFGLARFRAEREDDSAFVEDDSGVLDETRVQKSGFGGQ